MSELDVELIRLYHVVKRDWFVSSREAWWVKSRKDETSKLQVLCCDMNVYPRQL